MILSSLPKHHIISRVWRDYRAWSSEIRQTLAISSFVAARCPGGAIGAIDRLYLILPLGDRQST